MAEKLTEDQVLGLLAILKKETTVDAKVQYVTVVKSSIKQHNVPDACVANLFEGLRQASTSQHAALVNAGFTALNHLLTRLSRQEPKYLNREAKQTLSLIVDKMGDQKDKFRALAIQAMSTMYAHVPIDAERFVRNTAMVGKNPRAKESSMQWLLQMHKDQGLPFRAYVPTLMELLEDADGMVRDAAKSTVIELFRDAPNTAKSDLKRQLKNFKVRPAIESAIVKELNPTGTRADPESRPPSAMQVRSNLTASVSSHMSERPTTPMPQEAKTESVEPTYVNTQRELDDIFKDMHGWFEGKETEHNWMKREESMTKLRRLIAGNAATDFSELFISGCRSLLDGIIKAVNSLRTSLSKEGCALVQDLAVTFGPGIDPMVELLMQTFVKLCAATKKISSQMANAAVDILVAKTTYTVRLMQHLWAASQDKNVQPRIYATGWLKTLLKKEARHKNHLEHSGGLELIENCIKKGLNDPNPNVREKMRSTYWVFAGIWPSRAETIMDGLESTAQKLLRKDPNNPNSPKKTEPTARPGLGLSKSTMGSSKPSLKETMMAQKRALTTKTLPARPGSAMATLTPARTAPTPSNATTAPSAGQSGTRTRPEPSVKSHGGMSVAPMRPARRRPEMAARPATAGPYSVRTNDGPSMERSSPESVKPKTITPKAVPASPRRTAPRTLPGHAASASESSVSAPTPSKMLPSKTVSSPRTGPTGAKTTFGHPIASSPAEEENMTFLAPIISTQEGASLPSSPRVAVPPQNEPPVAHAVSSNPVSPPQPEPTLPLEPQKDEIAVLPSAQEATPSKVLQVYEDPFVEDQVPESHSNGNMERPALEDIPVNEDVSKLSQITTETINAGSPRSPDKMRQNFRLLDSGITRVKSRTLDVHGFRKLQSLIRENKLPFNDDKFNALLTGLFDYLEFTLDGLAPQKAQDVKAQALTTIKLLLKVNSDSFQPHVSRCLEALLRTRSSYDARTHIVAGLELLADELVHIGDAEEITLTITRSLGQMDLDTAGYRGLSMGLHVLKELIESRPSFAPTENEVAGLTSLASRCLDSKESGVRMDAVQLCVALHARIGDAKFWEFMKTVRDDPKSLITYYVVKRQREAKSTPC
ncbi:clasp N terminal-domain-containing protein [Xylaria intraflava]|nr:clasp N terminal-domain-containing protein [Xylaria intraflava]